ncbi:hypothetical protein D3C76_950010 [compost metagenome]
MQTQVFTVHQRAGNHEGLQAIAGLVDELLVARQGRCLTILEQLHVDRRVVLNHRCTDRVVGTGGIGPGSRQRSRHELRIRVSGGLSQHQVELERVIGFDDRRHLALIQSAQHFFGQRQPAGGRRQFSGIARRGRVAQRCQGFATSLVGGALGRTAQPIGHIAGAARHVIQAGRQLLPQCPRLGRIGLGRHRRKAVLRIHGLGELIECAHLQLQLQGDRFQRLGAQLLQIGGLRGAVEVVATIEASAELQRHTFGPMLLDGRELFA